MGRASAIRERVELSCIVEQFPCCELENQRGNYFSAFKRALRRALYLPAVFSRHGWWHGTSRLAIRRRLSCLTPRVRSEKAPPLRYEVRMTELEAMKRKFDGRPYVVIHPAALMETKRWAPGRFAQVAQGSAHA